MSEEERVAREQLIARILERSVYPLATWKKPEYPPILGPKYLEKLSALEAKRKVTALMQVSVRCRAAFYTSF